MIYGCDISFWQDNDATAAKVNFAKMRAAGASFVILRVGQGGWPDEDFTDYYQAAKQAGIPRGVYFFYDSRYSPASQAALCIAKLGNDYPELGVWGDFEDSYNGPYKGYLNWKTFLTALRAKVSKVGIYTGPYYWMENRPVSQVYLDFFGSFPLWIAHYGVMTPLVPGPWKTWVFWQYTSAGDGLAHGAESKEIDLDYYNGDLQSFQNFFNLPEYPGGEVTPPPFPQLLGGLPASMLPLTTFSEFTSDGLLTTALLDIVQVAPVHCPPIGPSARLKVSENGRVKAGAALLPLNKTGKICCLIFASHKITLSLSTFPY